MAIVTPNATIQNVLDALFGGSDGLLNFRACGPEYTTSAHYRLDDRVGIRAFLSNHALSRDCYVSMATYADDSSATADNAVHLPALFVDLDFKASSEADARKRLANFLYAASIVWNSGGGLHCAWMLREPVDLRNRAEVDQAASLLRRLAAALGADLAAAEPNRVLRVIKTFNRKPEYVPAKRPSDFDELLPGEPVETRVATQLVIPEVVEKGTRNRLLFRQGRSLKRQGLIPGAIRSALVSTNLACCAPPLAATEVDTIFASVMKQKDRKGFAATESVPLGSTQVVQAPPPDEGHTAAPPPAVDPPPAASAPAPPPPDEAIDLAALLDETVAYLRRFVVMSDHQLATMALWVGHSHSFEVAECTPYIHLTSATKRAGKTLLLEVLEPIVRRPWLTMRTTTAALPRKIDVQHPTLLLDESDQALREKSDYSAALVGTLNSGYRKSGTVSLCMGEGSKIQVVELSTFCPKVISGIGKLPDTIGDRSIAIKLRRRMRSETVERATHRQRNAAAVPLRRRWEAWAPRAAQVLLGAAPTLPAALDDRAQDVWETLLAIAELASPVWAERARRAAVALSGSREDEDHAVQLLADIREVMESAVVRDERGPGFDVVVTTALLKRLNGLSESLWPTWSRGGPMTANSLASLLAGFDLHSAQHHVAGTRKRGYRRDTLDALFPRYLGPKPSGRDNPNDSGGEPAVSGLSLLGVGSYRKPANHPMNTGVCLDLSPLTPGGAGVRLYRPLPKDVIIAALGAGREKSNGHQLTTDRLAALPPGHQPEEEESE
jgi:hypothetical protein